ncbi:MAG: hypothetical protein RIQ81_98 [Pseudomonadota bacterium]|jgi:D-3-phosphoglycerate dehydrogenase
MARIVVTAASFCANSTLVDEAKTAFARHEIYFQPLSPSSLPAQVQDALRPANVVILGREPVTAQVLAALPELKAVVKYGVGVDNIDFAAAARHGVAVIQSPGSNAFAVAEHTIGMIINLLHNISFCDRKLREGVWHKDGGQSLSGKRIAVIGVGNVGTKVARMLRAFDGDVAGVDLVDKSEFLNGIGARQLELADALSWADIVTLHVPLTDVTRGLFSASTFARMRRGSMLVNTSRGEIVLEGDLLQALESGQPGWAGLDVFAQEPTGNKALISHPQVLVTPHIAGNSREAVLAMGRAAISGLANWLDRV